jgi:hypothetical protein
MDTTTRKAYELSYKRTAKKIEQRKRKQEKLQAITLILLLCVTTVYTG